MEGAAARFAIGELVHHRLFDYRGVVYDVDPVFSGTQAWYTHVARSRPPRDRPWYHVLVHQSNATTYVAERNLEPDVSPEPIDHPELAAYFSRFRDGTYVPRRSTS